MDSHLLLTHKRKEGVLDQGTTNRLGGTLEQRIELLDVIAAADADEFQHGLVVLQRQGCLVAWEWTKKSILLPLFLARGIEGMENTYYHET